MYAAQNPEYLVQPTRLNSKPRWQTADGTPWLYSAPRLGGSAGAWAISTGTGGGELIRGCHFVQRHEPNRGYLWLLSCGTRISRGTTNASKRRVQTSGVYLHRAIGTHHVCGLGALDDGCTVAGQRTQQTRLVVFGGADIEAIAASKFSATSAEQREMRAAPSLEDMLASGRPAHPLFSSVVIQGDPPHIILPIDASHQANRCGGHRRLQGNGRRSPARATIHREMRRLASSIDGAVCSATGPTGTEGR